jgi:non-heme Fe2+,alpha-ketoglutarate-dependent halogenase
MQTATSADVTEPKSFRERLDLSFPPVKNLNPNVLTAEQIEFYNREGYLRPFDVFNPAEVERNRAYFDYLLASLKVLNDGRDSYAISSHQHRCQGIYEMATNPRILDLVEDIIGPNIIAWSSHFFCKLPHDPKAVPWHQDASYWPFTPSRTVTAWLAIDDADAENSAMQFIPRTHDKGHLKWNPTKGPAVLAQEIENIESYGKPVINELRAGQLSLHADMIVHGSEPNRSERRRCALTIRYCPPEVEVLNPEWAKQAIVARGEDTRGWWAKNPKPLGDDLSLNNRTKAIGTN